MPNKVDYHVDPLLTNMSVGYANNQMIANLILPTLEVEKENGIYFKFDKSSFRIEDSRRSGVTRAKRVDYGLVQATYGPIIEHSLEEAITWKERDQFPTPMSAYEEATQNVSDKLLLTYEKEVADYLRSTANLTQNRTLSGSDRWNDYANSDPVADVETGRAVIKAAGLVTPNTLIMGDEVWSKLKFHPGLLGLLSVASVRMLTLEMAASLLGVERILVGSAMYNSVDEGQTDSLSYVWGKDVILAYIAPVPKRKQVSLGYTMKLKNARVVDRWTETAFKSDFVRATDEYEPKIVCVEAAYLMKTVVD